MTVCLELHVTCDGEELLGDAYDGNACALCLPVDEDCPVLDPAGADLAELFDEAMRGVPKRKRFTSLALAIGTTAHLCPNCARRRSAIPRAQLQTETDET